MPTYQYRCTDCENEFEIVQKFSDAALTTCPECEGPLRKVFSPVGVVFKGSGFYATDNRTKGKANAATSSDSKSEGASDAGAGASGASGAGAAGSGAASGKGAASGTGTATTAAPAAKPSAAASTKPAAQA